MGRIMHNVTQTIGKGKGERVYSFYLALYTKSMPEVHELLHWWAEHYCCPSPPALDVLVLRDHALLGSWAES